MRPTGSAEELETRRRRAMDLLESGMSPAAVALAVGVARQTIQKWKAWVRDGGKKALKAVPQHVNTCRLTIQQQSERSAKYILWSVVGSMVLFPFTQELNHGSFHCFEQSRVLARGS
jgi:hypothetical protein